MIIYSSLVFRKMSLLCLFINVSVSIDFVVGIINQYYMSMVITNIYKLYL
jgi:hypothetical protein